MNPIDPLDRYRALGKRFQRLPRWAATLMGELAGDVERLERKMNDLKWKVCESEALRDPALKGAARDILTEIANFR